MRNKFNIKEIHKKWAEIVAKAWTDDEFKAKLLSHPDQVLAKYGFSHPSKVKFKVVEDTEDTIHLVLHKPPKKPLSETELNELKAGILISTTFDCSGG